MLYAVFLGIVLGVLTSVCVCVWTPRQVWYYLDDMSFYLFATVTGQLLACAIGEIVRLEIQGTGTHPGPGEAFVVLAIACSSTVMIIGMMVVETRSYRRACIRYGVNP